MTVHTESKSDQKVSKTKTIDPFELSANKPTWKNRTHVKPRTSAVKQKRPRRTRSTWGTREVKILGPTVTGTTINSDQEKDPITLNSNSENGHIEIRQGHHRTQTKENPNESATMNESDGNTVHNNKLQKTWPELHQRFSPGCVTVSTGQTW